MPPAKFVHHLSITGEGLHPALMRHPPLAISQNLGGGDGEGSFGGVAGGSFKEGGPEGLGGGGVGSRVRGGGGRLKGLGGESRLQRV